MPCAKIRNDWKYVLSFSQWRPQVNWKSCWYWTLCKILSLETSYWVIFHEAFTDLMWCYIICIYPHYKVQSPVFWPPPKPHKHPSCYLYMSQLLTPKQSLQGHKPHCQLWAWLCQCVGGGSSQVAPPWYGRCSAAYGCERLALWGLWLNHNEVPDRHAGTHQDLEWGRRKNGWGHFSLNDSDDDLSCFE